MAGCPRKSVDKKVFDTCFVKMWITSFHIFHIAALSDKHGVFTAVSRERSLPFSVGNPHFIHKMWIVKNVLSPVLGIRGDTKCWKRKFIFSIFCGMEKMPEKAVNITFSALDSEKLI